MKKLHLTLLALGLAFAAHAQFDQGSVYFGGRGSIDGAFLTTKAKDNGNTVTISKTTSFTVTPQVGYFVAERFLIGAAISLESSSETSELLDAELTSIMFTAGPFARYYLANGLFFEGSAAFGGSKTTLREFTYTEVSKASVVAWGLALGYAIRLSDTVTLDPIAGYASSTAENKEDPYKTVVSGLVLGIGFSVYLK